MSLLPQRKKSAGEIAKLRESLGIPGQSSMEDLPVEIDDSAAPAPEPPVSRSEGNPAPPAASALSPLPAPPQQEPKPVRSLKRSERMPALPLDESEPHPQASPEAHRVPASSPLPVARGIKPVRSLRKSELDPVPFHPRLEPAPDSPLPVHRHSDRELNEIRRREALAAIAQEVRPPSLSAHLAVIIPGYLSAIAGGVCFLFYDLEKRLLPLTAACVVVSLLLAGFIFFRKPLSRHHAAFIAVVALFVIVFGSIHYFPQLRHGT